MTDTASAGLSPEEAGKVFVTPSAYADDPLLHRAFAVLREKSPIHRVAMDGFPPFWAVTRHADVYDMARNSEVWRNEPRAVLQPLDREEYQRQQGELKTLIHLDDPHHRELRSLTIDWFKPRSLARLDDRLAELARASVGRMVELGGSCDFARDVAMPYPLQVILAILGLPEEDYPRMLTLTQNLFGGDDPEYTRGTSPEELQKVIMDFFAYFSELVADRQAQPTEDLASVVANASIAGQPLDIVEQLSYYVIVATAGHDTTSAAMAGGLQALIENPDQLRRLKDDPSLIATAADEIIRWVTPVKHFMRNAAVAADVGGHHFEAGDSVLLSYPSANRDAKVFPNPFTFDVGRSPNRHLAFGFGAHYCLGATLARMEIKALLTELLPRLDNVELAGEPALSQTLFVGGLKHLPIRYSLS
ncbi:MAG: cytochrome P450 [Actinomycetota bacterium]|nr:cytochrome P450 [Actinomycetota bacterium]